VIRSNEITGYKFLVDPIKLPFLLAYAPLRNKHDKKKDADVTAEWRQKIDGVLNVARLKAHDSLVLGAWGCGEMGNSLELVATLFREALVTRFKGCFRHVVFAFLHDPEAFRVFGRIFGAPQLPCAKEVEIYDRKGRNKRTVNINEPGDWQTDRKSRRERKDGEGQTNNKENKQGEEESEEEVMDWGDTRDYYRV
jgi:hypothetical protein